LFPAAADPILLLLLLLLSRPVLLLLLLLLVLFCCQYFYCCCCRPSGKQVVVLEARVTGGGNTGKQLGDLSTWNNNLYSRLQHWYGADITKKVSRRLGAPHAFLK
jgi:hypothetical protein